MSFESWWEKNCRLDKESSREIWRASQENARKLTLEYMIFVEEEFPEDERWECLKIFLKGKEL